MTTNCEVVRTDNFVLASTPIAEIIASATDHILVLAVDIAFYGTGDTAPIVVVGIGFPAATGVPQRATVPQSYDGGNPISNSVLVATSWTTPPTAPTNFLRRASFSIPAPTGQIQGNRMSRLIRFPAGIMVPVSKSLVVWTIGTTLGSAIQMLADVSFEFDA